MSFFILLAFFVNTLGIVPSAQADVFRLPAPGVMVQLSPEFNPPILKGIKVHPDNPFRFDFILDKGDSELKDAQLKDESSKLIKYFLASLTIPEKDLWVNLSPYEKDRIIPQSFGLTEMGRDLLAEDYMLKQITASLIYPEGETGKKFWERIYVEAEKKFGTTDIPVNTFNKVWIIPEIAVVYENAKAGTAYVVESKLKVMLEQDYLSLQKHNQKNVSFPNVPPGRDPAVAVTSVGNPDIINQLGSQITRQIVIPELTKEVNEGKNFVQLRQIYSSLILAEWYKKKIKDSVLSQVYENKNKVSGVTIADPQEKQKIYERYLQAFKKGVYNYIKEEQDPATQTVIPRKYFSGGVNCAMLSLKIKNMPIGAMSRKEITGPLGMKFTISVYVLNIQRVNDLRIRSYLSSIERKIAKGEDVQEDFREIYLSILGKKSAWLKKSRSARAMAIFTRTIPNFSKIMAGFVLDRAGYLGAEDVKDIVIDHDFDAGTRLRILRVWSQQNPSGTQPLCRKIQEALLKDNTPTSTAISRAIDLMQSNELFNRNIPNTTGAYFMWDDPFVMLSDYFSKIEFVDLINALPESESQDFYKMVLLLLTLKLTTQEKDDILIKILEPYLFQYPEELTLPILAYINNAYQDNHNVRYFLYYVAANHGVSIEVRHRAEAIIRERKFFALHKLMEDHFRHGEKNVLVIDNNDDGQGDEVVRENSLVQGLLDFNPDLKVTLIAEHSYLYSHARVKVIPIQDWVKIHEASEEHYDAVIDFYGKMTARDYDVEKHLRESDIEKGVFLNIRAQEKGYGNFVFEMIRVGGQDYVQQLNLNDRRPLEFNVAEVHARLNAELGLPFKEEGSESLINGMPNAQYQEQWQQMMLRVGNPLEQGRYQYPVVSLNPYGGTMEPKGLSRSKLEEQEWVDIIESLVNLGYKVVVFPNDKPWGTTRIAEELVDRVSRQNRGNVVVAPGPSADPKRLKYFIGYSSYVLTIEGGMMHLTMALGQPVGVISKLTSTFLRWVPFNRTRQQVAGVKDILRVLEHQKHQEQAMASETGGIDLSTTNKYLQTQNNGGEIKFRMDLAMLSQLQNAPGFVPVIINFQPITNLRQFLGLADNQST